MRPLRVVLAVSLVGLPLGSSACYSNVDSFAQRAAKLYCKRLEECNKSFFEDVYDGDIDKCREEYEDSLLDVYNDLECEYDAEEGRACISEAYSSRKDCSDGADNAINDACEDVYYDCSAPWGG